MKTFPIMLDMHRRSAVVVGAGPVGLRRARALVEAGARVTLVDPAAPADAPEGVTVVRAPYEPAQLAGATLVFACTDDRELNSRIAADARRAGALANAADQVADCDFHCPALIRDRDVVVAVGTGGTAAALAVTLRDRLASAMPARVGEFAEALAALRGQVRPMGPARRRMEITGRLSSQEAYDIFVARGPAGLRQMLEQLVKESADADPVRRTGP